MPSHRRFIDYRAAILLVIANMVGTGVFTTLGLQAAAVPNGAALLLLWGLGALVSLCGALSYAELAAAIPRSGGEYHFLSRIYHPALGQLAGLVSITVGFAAPVALAAMALGRYAQTFLNAEPVWIAVLAILFIAAVHAVKVEFGRAFQVVSTLLKIAVILILCTVMLMHEAVPGSLSPWPSEETLAWVFSAPFGLALIYVSYAYAGWNAAAYVVDEVRNPEQTVPRALTHGTLAVGVIYLLLNLAFLRTIALDDLAGTVEIGAVAAQTVFGEPGARLLSLVLCVLLLSSISAMVLAGPRVLRTMGEDIPTLSALAICNRRGAPTRAVLVQQGLALAFVLTDSFEGVLTAAGFTLALFSWITVAGVFRFRVRKPMLIRPFRIPLFPLPPLLFLAVSGLGLMAVLFARPLTAVVILGVLSLIGAVLYRHSNPSTRRHT